MAEPESSHDVTESLRNKEVITVVLDKASLETVKMKSGQYCLLNCDDHQAMMKKSGKNPADYRPDILHQELLALLDSPLNKVGKLKVYIRSSSNVLIEVNAKCRIPRTYKRFAGLMVQLLHKLKVRSADGKATLLKVIKNPVTRYLPAGFKCYGFSVQGTLYNPNALACTLPDDKPVVFVLGAMAAGHITVQDHPYTRLEDFAGLDITLDSRDAVFHLLQISSIEEMVSVSDFPLSGATAINRLLGAIENYWGIV